MNAVPDRPAPVSSLLLAAASGLSPFGMASIVPAMPAFADFFAADYAQVQLVVAAYLLGLGIAQAVHGALCDMFGRRATLLSGFLIFAIASLVCAFVTRLDALVLARFFQALGVSVGTVASRAIVRDTYDTERGAIALSYITAAMGIAPVVAPFVGGLLVQQSGWRSIFILNALLGALLLAWMYRALPETQLRAHRLGLDPVRMLIHYGELLRERRFLGYSLIYGFSSAGIFAFLTVGAAVYERYAGLDATGFGGLWGGLAVLYAGGAWLGASLGRRRGMAPLLRDGVVAMLVLGVAFPIVLALHGANAATLTVPIGALLVANGLISPQALAGAVGTRPEIAGIASGLSSSLAMFASMLFTAVSGATFDGTAMPAALLIAAATCGVAGAWWATRSPPRRRDSPRRSGGRIDADVER